MKINLFIRFVLTIIILILTQQLGCGSSKTENGTPSPITEPDDPDQVITCANFAYACYNDVWYTYFDGFRGDRLDLAHITARLVDGAEINNFNFNAVGLPDLIVNRVVASNYYELNVPESYDSFILAQTLWDTGEFELIQFNFFIEIDAS